MRHILKKGFVNINKYIPRVMSHEISCNMKGCKAIYFISCNCLFNLIIAACRPLSQSAKKAEPKPYSN